MQKCDSRHRLQSLRTNMLTFSKKLTGNRKQYVEMYLQIVFTTLAKPKYLHAKVRKKL